MGTAKCQQGLLQQRCLHVSYLHGEQRMPKLHFRLGSALGWQILYCHVFHVLWLFLIWPSSAAQLPSTMPAAHWWQTSSRAPLGRLVWINDPPLRASCPLHGACALPLAGLMQTNLAVMQDATSLLPGNLPRPSRLVCIAPVRMLGCCLFFRPGGCIPWGMCGTFLGADTDSIMLPACSGSCLRPQTCARACIAMQQP